MTRACMGALIAIALAGGLALRFARLDARPMHHDEANQAVKFGELLERGEYRYDAHDHHGPTLYYLTLPAAKLRGQTTFASLDERTLRGVTVIFGVATILLLPLLAPGIGRTAVAAAAILMALSPAVVFYSRMFIQESLFACFTLAFAIALGRVVTGGGLRWAAIAGGAAGLTVATKETSVVVLPAALAACAIAWWSVQPEWRSIVTARRWLRPVIMGIATALAVAAMFYSSFFTAPGAVLDPFRGASTYLDRGLGASEHVHPWHFYLGLLTYYSSGGLKWSEGLVLALAAVGLVAAWKSPRAESSGERAFWPRYLSAYALLATIIFSAIPYKTPWNLLPFYVAVIVAAGIGFSILLHLSPSRIVRGVVVAAFAVALVHLGRQSWRASVTYAADPRNPYVYSQTVPDAVRMAARIRELAALHPDGARMLVTVVAGPYEQWPLPWYLRTMPHVGYWTAPGDALALNAPVVVASMDHAAAIEAAVGDRYVSEFYGLRPEVLMTLLVERGLWDRFLARQASSMALWRAAGAP
jgi:uncharacterized protein (TIGR03663 family)